MSYFRPYKRQISVLCDFWPMLGTSAVRFLKRATPMWRCHYLFYDLILGFKLPTFRFQDERSNLLRHQLALKNDQWVLVSLESRTSGLLFNYFLCCLCCSTSNTFFKIFDFFRWSLLLSMFYKIFWMIIYFLPAILFQPVSNISCHWSAITSWKWLADGIK